MMHQGARPTFGDASRSIEAHVFDVDVDLYGELVKLSWIARLRDVAQFGSAVELKQQLDKDFMAARAALTQWRSQASH
jgi:riboflavin kinase/FMN adenylyltransferase